MGCRNDGGLAGLSGVTRQTDSRGGRAWILAHARRLCRLSVHVGPYAPPPADRLGDRGKTSPGVSAEDALDDYSAGA